MGSSSSTLKNDKLTLITGTDSSSESLEAYFKDDMPVQGNTTTEDSLPCDSPQSAMKCLGLTQRYSLDETLFEKKIAALKSWNLMLSNIHEKTGLGYIAIRIIYMTSFFASKDIPIGIFSDTKPFPNQTKLNATVDILKQYGIISGPVGMINVDPLLQEFVKLHLPVGNTKEILEDILKGFERHLCSRTEDKDLNKLLLPHVKSVWTHTKQHQKLVRKCSEFPFVLALMQDEYLDTYIQKCFN